MTRVASWPATVYRSMPGPRGTAKWALRQRIPLGDGLGLAVVRAAYGQLGGIPAFPDDVLGPVPGRPADITEAELAIALPDLLDLAVHGVFLLEPVEPGHPTYGWPRSGSLTA